MLTLRQLAEKLQCPFTGDGDTLISRAAAIESAGPGDLSFVANPKYVKHLMTTAAGAVVLPPEESFDRLPTLRSSNPYLTFAQAVDILYATPPSATGTLPSTTGVSSLAYVAPDAQVAENVTIEAFSFVGAGAVIGAETRIAPQVYIGERVTIGARCLLYPGVRVLEDCVLGDDVILHAGVALGSDGFGYAPSPTGLKKIKQVGNVIVGDRVEIGANTCVDRAALGSTKIGAGTKIDNLVQIAHNVEIGRNCVIVAQVGVSGSTKLGDQVTLAGQVGVVGHITIGDGVVVAAQSGVSKDVPVGMTLLGSPAHEIGHRRRVEAVVNNLPDLLKRIRALEREIEALKSSNRS